LASAEKREREKGGRRDGSFSLLLLIPSLPSTTRGGKGRGLYQGMLTSRGVEKKKKRRKGRRKGGEKASANCRASTWVLRAVVPRGAGARTGGGGGEKCWKKKGRKDPFGSNADVNRLKE